jgi:purine-nucleoside phosphorylase
MIYPTWSDLNNESIVPPFGARRAHDIGPVAVMASCEPDMRLLGSNFVTPKCTPFFTSTLITRDGGGKGISIAGPFIGSPYGAMLLESLIAKGADRIVVLGWCGAVTDDLAVGDIILVEKAIVDEGTSANYRILDENIPCSCPDTGFMEQFSDHLSASGVAFRRATVWTTDAIYRETQNKVAFFRNLGALAVEMECSALFSVARYRNVSIAGLLVVSDSVASNDWDPGFRKKQFNQARKTACSSVMGFAESMCANE